TFETADGPVPAVDDVSFDIRAGETLGLVGESGSGKSVTALSIMRLVQPPGQIATGRVLYKGRDLLSLPEREMRAVRGAEIALACRPSLLIADEPTTALDVTIQAQILDLLREMKAAYQLSLLLITHDLGVIAETADRVAVMYAGRIVETGPVRAILRTPQHP